MVVLWMIMIMVVVVVCVCVYATWCNMELYVQSAGLFIDTYVYVSYVWQEMSMMQMRRMCCACVVLEQEHVYITHGGIQHKCLLCTIYHCMHLTLCLPYNVVVIHFYSWFTSY